MCIFSCFISSLRHFYRLFWLYLHTPTSARSSPNPVSFKKRNKHKFVLILYSWMHGLPLECGVVCVCLTVCLSVCLTLSVCFVWHQWMNYNSFSSYSKQIIRKGGTKSCIARRKDTQCTTQENTFMLRVYNQNKIGELRLSNSFGL